VYGIYTGYKGLLDTDEITRLTPEKVAGIVSLGGTILGTTNKGDPFRMPIRNAAGDLETRDVSAKILSNFKRLGLDVLIAVGGDGSLRLANRFAQMGMPIIGVPKTIDNEPGQHRGDLRLRTRRVTTATEAIDKLHSTAAPSAGDGGGGDGAAMPAGSPSTAASPAPATRSSSPRSPSTWSASAARIMDNELHGKDYGIVVVAEGAKPRAAK
jgi:6-phosphofructokinase 1